MTLDRDSLDHFKRILDGALDLFEGHDIPTSLGAGYARLLEQPLSELLATGHEILAAPDEHLEEPIRSVHHFACSGGTLITKALASSANTVPFSEIDPLGVHHLSARKRPFFPTDLIADLRYSPRPVDQDIIIDVFLASLQAIYEKFVLKGYRILLRDHAHSQFCTSQQASSRPPLRVVVAQRFDLLSMVTVRHPIDSYTSLRANDWMHFQPGTLEEYSQRYLAFLNAHADLTIFRYEDFVAAPKETLSAMQALLQLPPVEDFETLMPLFSSSGDSGRRGGAIAPRPRRILAEGIVEESRDSGSYQTLCARLGYQPDVRETPL